MLKKQNAPHSAHKRILVPALTLICASASLPFASAGIRDTSFDGMFRSPPRSERVIIRAFDADHRLVGEIESRSDRFAESNRSARLLTTEGGRELTLNRNLLPLLGESPSTYEGALGELLAEASLANPRLPQGINLNYRGRGGITRWEAGTFDLVKSVAETMPYITLESDASCDVEAAEGVEVRMNRDLKSGVIWETIEYRIGSPDEGDSEVRLACSQILAEIADSLLIHSDIGSGAFYLHRLANAIEGIGMTNPDVSVSDPLTLEEFAAIGFIELERSADLIRTK